MGASSSGLLDEAKISNIKGLVDGTLQSFSVCYRQQYSAAYFRHLHQEVEPKKEGRGLLLTQGPQYAPEEVLYQGGVKFSCWDDQGKKCRERFAVLRKDYKVEIHETKETFSRGCAAKLILQPAGGRVFTTEGESRAHLEQTCAGILNGVKEDSSSVVSSPDVLAVYLHLPYTGYTCFLFQQAEEQGHFRAALNTCIRHCNLDPWCDSSYESEAYVRALRLYRQDKGSYESWEMLLGTEEQVLASQVMEEVLPWLQSQLQSKVKGKRTERIRQWLATVQATYTLVLEQLTASLEALRGECRETASASQALIRSNLDQIMSSHSFLEEKVRACIREEADKVCSESVAPYMSSILEALTGNISAGIRGMQRTLRTQMDSAFTHTNGGTEETKKALSTLRAISLDQWYLQVENLTEKLEGLKQRFGLSSTQRLVHSAHLEMEKLLDSTVYTFELFLQSSARLQPSQIPVKMERAKERVLKQLDYDSRVVQRRLYEEALLEITLPALTRGTDSKWKTELQQFEQYIFSDYSSFILVQNVYDGVLRNILSKEIQTVVQDAASKKSNNLLLDTADLGISQYSLLGHTPPRSAPASPAAHARDPSPAALSEEPAPALGEEPAPAPREEPAPALAEEPAPALSGEPAPALAEEPAPALSGEPAPALSGEPAPALSEEPAPAPREEPAPALAEEPAPALGGEPAPVRVEGGQTVTADLQSDPELNADVKSEPSTTQSSDQRTALTSPLIIVTQQLDASSPEEASRIEETPSPTYESPHSDTPDAAVTQEVGTPDAPANPESTDPIQDPPDLPVPALSTEDPSDHSATPDLSTSDQVTEDAASLQPPCPSATRPPSEDGPMTISLGSLSEAIGCSSAAPVMAQQTTDRAVYLTGEIKDNWEVERAKVEKEMESAKTNGGDEGIKEGNEETGEGKEEETEEEKGEGQTGGEAADGRSSESPAESATELGEEKVDDEEKGSELETEQRKEEEEVLQSPQPIESEPESAAELPLDSVAIIRELVTEITEVETVIRSCPNGGHTP